MSKLKLETDNMKAKMQIRIEDGFQSVNQEIGPMKEKLQFMDDTLDVKKWVIQKIKEENKDFEDKIDNQKKNHAKLIIKL